MTISVGVAIAVVSLNLLTAIISVAGFLMVKFNDLKHLTEDVKNLGKDIKEETDKLQKDSDTKHKENKENIKELSKLVAKLATVQAERIGICETRHQ